MSHQVSQSVKGQILELIKISRDERAYFGKFIDAFFDMSQVHQRGILEYFVENVGPDHWTVLLSDEFRWIDLVKSILTYYSGRISAKDQPDRNELAMMIGRYTKTNQFNQLLQGES